MDDKQVWKARMMIKKIIAFILCILPSVCFGATTHWCDTISEINTAFSVASNGDTIAIKCDATYTLTSQLTVPASNVTVDAYYGTSTLVGSSGNFSGHTRPVLDGRNLGDWDSIIRVTNSRTGVTVRNLALDESSCFGLYFLDGYGTAYNCVITDCYNKGWHVKDCTDGPEVLIDSCITKRCGEKSMSEVASVKNSENVTIKNCIISDVVPGGSGKGALGIFGNATGPIYVLNNTIYNCNKGVTVEHSRDIVIVGNLIYNDTESPWSMTNIYCLNENDEAYSGTGMNKWVRIYDNLLANAGSQISVSGGGGGLTSGVPQGPDHFFIAHNTIVDLNNAAISIGSSGANYNWQAYNNILWRNGAVHSGVCTGSTWKNNLIYGTGVSLGCTATGTIHANPNLTKSSGWDEISPGEIDQSSFQIGDGPARDGGTWIDQVNDSGSKTTVIVDNAWRFYVGQTVYFATAAVSRILTGVSISANTITFSGAVTVTNNEYIYHRGKLPDIGAREFATQPPNQPPIVSITAPTGDQCWETTASELTFTCIASDPDSDPITYQWFDNAVAIPGATSASLGLYGGGTGTTWADEEVHTISVVVSDGKITSQDAIDITVQGDGECEGPGPGGDPVTVTFGERPGDTYQGVTTDSYIHGSVSKQALAFDEIVLVAAGRATDDYKRKTLIGFNTAAVAGVTVTGASLNLNCYDPPETQLGLDVYKTHDDDDFTEAATWLTYNGVNAWNEADHRTDVVVDSTNNIGPGTLGWVTLTHADMVTYVAAKIGEIIYFVVEEDEPNLGDYSAYRSSEYGGDTTLRPYLSVTYTTPAEVGDITECRFTTADGTYGSGKVIDGWCQWDQPVSFTWAETRPKIVFETGGDDLECEIQTASTVSQSRHFIKGTTDADDNSADLDYIDQVGDDIILADGDTCSGNLEIPDDAAFADFSAIVIDTLAPEPGPGGDPLPATLYLCNEDEEQITGENVNYTIAGTLVYVCTGFQTAGLANDIGCHNVGASEDLGLITNLYNANGDAVYWRPYKGLGTHKWIWAHMLEAGDRTKTNTEWVLTNSNIQQTDSTIIVDVAGNVLSTYDTLITDTLVGNEVKIYVPKTDWGIGTGGDFLTLSAFVTAMGRSIPGDQFVYTSAQSLLDTDVAGAEGNVIIHNLSNYISTFIKMDQEFNRVVRARCG